MKFYPRNVEEREQSRPLVAENIKIQMIFFIKWNLAGRDSAILDLRWGKKREEGGKMCLLHPLRASVSNRRVGNDVMTKSKNLLPSIHQYSSKHYSLR